MPNVHKNYAVEFAERYRNQVGGYLSASSALWRLGDLIADVEEVKGYLDGAFPDGPPFAPWVGAEIVSYYAVGFVTCLEWHARSRLVDMLTFFPSTFKSEDLRAIKDKTLVETLVLNVTVAAVVGASTNVSSIDEYMGIFNRLFLALNLSSDAYAAIKAIRPETKDPWVAEEEIERLRELYIFRNDLVHEVGIDRVGHHNIRERWDVETALKLGDLVHRTISAIEMCIATNAPGGFPNVLDSDGSPKSEVARLKNELPELESKVARAVSSFSKYEDNTTAEQWENACNLSRIHLDTELDFIECAAMFHNRYLDLKEPLRFNLIKARHSYLLAILEEVGSVYDQDGDGSIKLD